MLPNAVGDESYSRDVSLESEHVSLAISLYSFGGDSFTTWSDKTWSINHAWDYSPNNQYLQIGQMGAIYCEECIHTLPNVVLMNKKIDEDYQRRKSLKRHMMNAWQLWSLNQDFWSSLKIDKDYSDQRDVLLDNI